MKQKRNPNLKEFWYHTDLIPISSTYPKPKVNEYILTFCGLYNPQTEMMKIGVSFCNVTTEKNYNRKIGNAIAYGRAEKRHVTFLNIIPTYKDDKSLDCKSIYQTFASECNKMIEVSETLLYNVSNKIRMELC